MSLYDAVVIGSGPAGITAALYLVRSGCTVAMVEKLTPGGQVLLTESIENYPGFPQGIRGYELVDAMAAHLNDLPIDRFTETVKQIDVQGKGLHKVLIGNTWLEAKTVLICAGASHQHLGVEHEMRLTGHGVSYCAICDGNFFRNIDVAVVGGGNTALEEALYLAKIAKKVYLIHRRNSFRGAKVYLDRLLALENVEILRSTVITALHGDNNLTGITVKNVQDTMEKNLSLEGLFVSVGIKPSVDFVPDSVQKDAQGFIHTDTEMRTNIPGIFAAGDIRSKLCRQVSTAVGDGATAAQAAFLYLEENNA